MENIPMIYHKSISRPYPIQKDAIGTLGIFIGYEKQQWRIIFATDGIIRLDEWIRCKQIM